MTEFRGARGSNAGDDFHELWATRQAIRLLLNEDGLQAVAVEGLARVDEAGHTQDAWDGVDCTLYFGGADAATAERIELHQLKYSGAAPSTPWTVARLISGRRDQCVLGKLAKAWSKLLAQRPPTSWPSIHLISNQPPHSDLVSAIDRAKSPSFRGVHSKPRKTSSDEAHLAYATGLVPEQVQPFLSLLNLNMGGGSRFASEEGVLAAIAAWTDQDVQVVLTGLRQFIRTFMRPERAGELITRESMLLQFGASDPGGLFPCPSEIARMATPIGRAPVQHAAQRIVQGAQYVCLHGAGGVGKTTALQEIERSLPPGSVMIKYDCYGGGRYLDPSALRHRSADAFLQLTNEVATSLRLPLLIAKRAASDYPRLFMRRLQHAATALVRQHPAAFIVVAIDAADNAVTAAGSRLPTEAPFVWDFALLCDLPSNVRFVITARTGRLPQLKLPQSYETIEIKAFSRAETKKNVARIWPAPEPWIDDFHHFSGGVPRVQSYAFNVDDSHPSTALDRLRPAGKSLDEIFRLQFKLALAKNGDPTLVAALCAALIALPRPVPVVDLAGVLQTSAAQVADLCADLAPGIRSVDGHVGFADEDFEDFVRHEARSELTRIQGQAANWLLSRAPHDPYASLNVAPVLFAAQRGTALIDLVEREPSPEAITDPVLRREAELQRLRLAIKVCREAGDPARALRFVLIGAEGIKTEAAITELLVGHPDLAARFARETAGRLILADPEHVAAHGSLLLQKLAVDADNRDGISVREGRRLLRAWFQLRHDTAARERHSHSSWEITTADVASAAEAALKLNGASAALAELSRWTPRRLALEVTLTLPERLIAEGQPELIEAVLQEPSFPKAASLLLQNQLALAGRATDTDRLAQSLATIARRGLGLKAFFSGYQGERSTSEQLLDAVLTSCEILTAKQQAHDLVVSVLDRFLEPAWRKIEHRYVHEAAKLDFLFRAYALKEARAGRKPDGKSVFVPRPPPPKTQGQRSSHDPTGSERDLVEVTNLIFGVYAAVAAALVSSAETEAPDLAMTEQAVRNLEKEAWRIDRMHTAHVVRTYAARSALALLATNLDPLPIYSVAMRIHPVWDNGYLTPSEAFIARLSLRPALHSELLASLSAAAGKARQVRIGADEKSRLLVSFARLIRSINPNDANAIFNEAIRAASELDREVIAQIRFFDRLATIAAPALQQPRETARRLSDIVADAAIRLDGYDHFPWEESIALLTRLDAPLALANVARWDDENVAELHQTLEPTLRIGMACGSISPAQATALNVFIDRSQDVLTDAVEISRAADRAATGALAEEASREVLLRLRQRPQERLTHAIDRLPPHGPWVTTLKEQEAYLTALPTHPVDQSAAQMDLDRVRTEPAIEHVWQRAELVDAQALLAAIRADGDSRNDDRPYVRVGAILETARLAVQPRDRVAHLKALSVLEISGWADDVIRALMRAIESWKDAPSTHEWCRTELANVILQRLPFFVRYFSFGQGPLIKALELTGLPSTEIQKLLLAGIERHVDSFDANTIFALTGLVGTKLEPGDAALLVDWYASRLADRIAPDERDQTAPADALPQTVDQAAARFLFGYLGDVDLRMRWRAAHGMRRLARLGETSTLQEILEQYDRRQDPAFRSRSHPFYWLAARLWFVMSWDRIAQEAPQAASCAGAALIVVALDDDFPHLLIRGFARDTCGRLLAAGRLALTGEQREKLRRVNISPLARVSGKKHRHHGLHREREDGRFRFDPMDSVPYWFEPITRGFASVETNTILDIAETWIVDRWGYTEDVRSLDKERRRGRHRDRDWALFSHRHGSLPTLENLRTHLEWHAMWCAAGELLKAQPLIARKADDWDTWDDLESRIGRHKTSESPLWSSDLLVPTPLQARYWQSPTEELSRWLVGAVELDHRAEMFPSDRPGYLVVDQYTSVRTRDRVETVHLSSALVSPAEAGALLRCLQTMDDAWDYKLPDEDEESAEINTVPYRLTGWLISPHRDGGIDEKDTFRGFASLIDPRPGRRVTDMCGLVQSFDRGVSWVAGASPDGPPMFIFEAWGEEETDDERFRSGVSAGGRRLLVHREQLQHFLNMIKMDLVVEVGINRRERTDRRHTGEEETSREARYDRLYRVSQDGGLYVAEGCIGAWAEDRRAA